ncbi:MAG: peptide chain release factor 1 [Clostridiales bacterium]|jgi:peptide chain release factor 1|nr:peptide chain release factor 1 [Clostridiales bacterium]
MFERLNEIEQKFDKLSEMVNNPEVICDQAKWRELMKEHSALEDVVRVFREYKDAEAALAEAKEMLSAERDEEMKALLKDEIKEKTDETERLGDELKLLLLPRDPNDDKNVYVEIRGGAGGDEAALFAYDLFRMYGRYAERSRFKTEIISENPSELGGFKEIVFLISGSGAYSRFKYESGVHRVQRIPATESGGRIHTSTVTVAVLPEVDEVEAPLDLNDVRVDVFRSSGNGGQSVNTTDSAVRVTHLPTGIVISCQDEKSQLKNKDKALKALRAKLYDLELEKRNSELSSQRRSQVGTGDRSEKVRTYNFPQSRVTDHRIKENFNLDKTLDGSLDEIMDALITTDRAKKLKEGLRDD